jgi:hypothetical protein
MAANTLGFFSCMSSNGRYVGAIMITDAEGIPQEFKYTEPVKPTRLQTILYGGSLEKYIKHEVIRGKLIKSVSKKPEIIFANNSDPTMMGKYDGLSIVLIHRARIKDLEEVGQVKQPKENELIIKDHESRDPLRIICAPDDVANLQKISEMAMEIKYKLDIIEPLERVDTALDAILKETSNK